MATFNKAILIGNLVADPELKQTPQGTSCCRFRIAVQRRFAKEGAEQTADFIDIVAWRQTAEFVCKYFRKGKPILICGQIQTRSWTDQQGGKRYATEVVADEVSFVESASASAGYTQAAQSGQTPSPAPSAQQSANTAAGTPYIPSAYIPDAGRQMEFESYQPDDQLPF